MRRSWREMVTWACFLAKFSAQSSLKLKRITMSDTRISVRGEAVSLLTLRGASLANKKTESSSYCQVSRAAHPIDTSRKWSTKVLRMATAPSSSTTWLPNTRTPRTYVVWIGRRGRWWTMWWQWSINNFRGVKSMALALVLAGAIFWSWRLCRVKTVNFRLFALFRRHSM